MADFGAPVASQVDVSPQKAFETIGSLMGLTAKRQALAGQAADVQQKQQDAGQRAALAQIDWAKHTGPDGTLNLDSFNQDQGIRKAAGDFYPDILAKAAQIKTAQTGAKQSLLNLNTDQLNAWRSTVGGLAGDPDVQKDTPAGRQKVANAYQSYGQTYGPDAAKAVAPYQGPLTQAPQGKLASVLQHVQMQSQDAGKQLEMMAPKAATVDTGGTIQPGATASTLGPTPGAFTPAGTSIPKQLPPSIVQTPGGSLAATGGARGTALTPLGGGGLANAPAVRTSQQDAPPLNAPAAAQQNFLDAAKQARDHVAQVRSADADYGTNVALSNTIRKLSANTATGPGTDIWHHALGALGAPVGANNIADYQLIGAYLDRQAAMTRQQMGLPATNEGQSTSQAIAGNVGYQQKALQDKNDLTQALAEGLHSYRNGLDRVEGFTGNPSPKAVQEFKSAWVNNFDPNVYKLENAQKRIKEDPTAVKKLLAELSPAEAASLREKRKNLQALQQGQLPK